MDDSNCYVSIYNCDVFDIYVTYPLKNISCIRVYNNKLPTRFQKIYQNKEVKSSVDNKIS